MATRTLIQTTRLRGEDVGLPPLRRAQVVIPPAEIATLFTAPVVLIGGQFRKLILPTHMHIRKQAGTAWTTAGSGTLRVKYAGSNSHHWNMFDQAATTAFFGAGEAVWYGEAGKGQFWGFGDSTASGPINGAGVVLDLATANISGGTGRLIVNLWYREWEGI